MPPEGPGDHPLTDILHWKLPVYGDKADALIREIRALLSNRETLEWWGREIAWDASPEAMLPKAISRYEELLKRAKQSGWEIEARSHNGHDIGLVLFDVGGVLIDLHSEEAEAVLEREYGLDRASYERIAKPAMERAVIGKIGTTDLLQAFCAACERDVTIEEMKSNLESVIGDERPAMLELVRKVSRCARVAAFTNTFELHWRLLQNPDRYQFPVLMERVIASHHIGLAKPMSAAYQAAAQLLGLQPENILFVDDLAENVNGARESGMVGILFEDCPTLRTALQRLALV